MWSNNVTLSFKSATNKSIDFYQLFTYEWKSSRIWTLIFKFIEQVDNSWLIHQYFISKSEAESTTDGCKKEENNAERVKYQKSKDVFIN